jgi:hypothetical protein
MLGMGWVTKWWQLVICRTLLGMLEAGFFPACELFSLDFRTAYAELYTRYLYHQYMVRARGDPETNDRFLRPGCHGELRIVALYCIALTIHTGQWLLLCHFWWYLRARWPAWSERVAMDIYHLWSGHYFAGIIAFFGTSFSLHSTSPF